MTSPLDSESMFRVNSSNYNISRMYKKKNNYNVVYICVDVFAEVGTIHKRMPSADIRMKAFMKIYFIMERSVFHVTYTPILITWIYPWCCNLCSACQRSTTCGLPRGRTIFQYDSSPAVNRHSHFPDNIKTPYLGNLIFYEIILITWHVCIFKPLKLMLNFNNKV